MAVTIQVDVYAYVKRIISNLRKENAEFKALLDAKDKETEERVSALYDSIRSFAEMVGEKQRESTSLKSKLDAIEKTATVKAQWVKTLDNSKQVLDMENQIADLKTELAAAKIAGDEMQQQRDCAEARINELQEKSEEIERLRQQRDSAKDTVYLHWETIQCQAKELERLRQIEADVVTLNKEWHWSAAPMNRACIDAAMHLNKVTL